VSSIISAFCDKIKTSFTQLCKTHLITSLQLFNTLKNAQKPNKLLPEKKLSPTNKKTIIFDLDETLIHCNESVDSPCD
jgi:CTD small phosphatase-like protein 2